MGRSRADARAAGAGPPRGRAGISEVLIPEAGVGPGAERPNLRAAPRRGLPAPGAPSSGVRRPWRVAGRGKPKVHWP